MTAHGTPDNSGLKHQSGRYSSWQDRCSRVFETIVFGLIVFFSFAAITAVLLLMGYVVFLLLYPTAREAGHAKALADSNWYLRLFIAAIALAVLSIALVMIRAYLERRIVRNRRPRHPPYPRSTFWDAFPFASLVFFIVSVTVALDIYGDAAAAAGTQERMVLRLALGLTAAIVTGIVVLFGAHLVRFESKIQSFTDETEDAKKAVQDEATAIQSAVRNLDAGVGEMKNLTDTARQITDSTERLDADMHRVLSTMGVAVVAMEAEGRYRRAARTLPADTDIDRYIEAKCALTITSGDAVLVDGAPHRLDKTYIPTSRNMLSSFLSEMAWDVGSRCLVTNAVNYTSFLVGAARGFEEVLDNGDYSDTHKVFYLTHTRVHPALLLNWADDWAGEADKQQVRMCHARPFMFEYMAYCRYFAAHKNRFIHARQIRATTTPPKPWFGEDTQTFGMDALHGTADNGLPTHCLAAGLPFNARFSVGGKPYLYHPEGRSTDTDIDLSPRNPEIAERNLAAFLAISASGLHLESHEDGRRAVFWPLMRQNDDAGLGQTLASMEARQRMLKYLGDTGLANRLASHYASDSSSAHRHELLKESVKQFQKLFADKRGGGHWWRTSRTYHDNPEEGIDSVDKLFKAYETWLVPIRWGFQGRAGDSGLKGQGLDAWEDVRLATLMLANSILGELSGSEDKPCEFIPWFTRTFHTHESLYCPYCPELEEWDSKSLFDALDADAQLPESGNNANLALWRSLWDDLPDLEFALIGIVDTEGWGFDNTAERLSGALQSWSNNPKQSGGEIRQIMGLTSTIESPWKHAEMAWSWPCENGTPNLQAMAKYYAKVMQAERTT